MLFTSIIFIYTLLLTLCLYFLFWRLNHIKFIKILIDTSELNLSVLYFLGYPLLPL